MRIGLLLNGLHGANATGALAAEAEALGFDSLWAGDHVAFPSPILDPLQILACCAGHTRHLLLGTCVYLLPLRHPTVVAKMASSLDVLSHGRVVFGIGVGGEFPAEFEAVGVPVRERGARTDEAIAVLRHLWRGEPAAHAGRFFRIGPMTLKPRPAQAGGPPIWIGGRSEAAYRRAARHGDGYLGHFLSPDGFRDCLARIRALAAEAGRAERPFAAALMAFALVAPTRDAALRRAATALRAMYGQDMERAADRYAVLGAPRDCAEVVARYAAAGVEHLVLTPLAPLAGIPEQVREIAAALSLRPRA